MDEVFGTHVCTGENDDYINVYADYDMKRGIMCDSLTVTLWQGEDCEEFKYSLTDEEKALLLPKMEEYCKQQTGKSLAEYSAERMDEERRDAASREVQPTKNTVKKWKEAR